MRFGRSLPVAIVAQQQSSGVETDQVDHGSGGSLVKILRSGRALQHVDDGPQPLGQPLGFSCSQAGQRGRRRQRLQNLARNGDRRGQALHVAGLFVVSFDANLQGGQIELAGDKQFAALARSERSTVQRDGVVGGQVDRLHTFFG